MYSLQIFNKADIVLNKYVLAILIQAAFTICNFLSAHLMKVCARRLQFILSGLIMCLSLFLIGYLINFEGKLSRLQKVSQPLLFMVIAFAYSCGYGTVTYSLGAELFPSEVKGICTAVPLAIM